MGQGKLAGEVSQRVFVLQMATSGVTGSARTLTRIIIIVYVSNP